MLFSDIIGLAEIKKTLINSVHKAHVAHAQLFMGNDGSANLATALAYAQYINCEEVQSEDACGKCSSCVQFAKLTHPDLHLVFPSTSLEKVSKEDLKSHLTRQFRSFVQENPFGNMHDWGSYVGAENKQFNISVEEGRAINAAVALKAYQAEYKVVLLWMPEYMHISTANAILKILEEPPAKTIFLLVASDYEKLLPTIVSRCQMVKIRAFDFEETCEYLITIKNIEKSIANRIAKIADGNLNKANILAGSEVDDNHALFANWMRITFSRKYPEILLFCDDLSKRGRENQKNLLQYSIRVVRDALMHRLDTGQLIRQEEEEITFIENFSKILRPQYSEQIYQELNTAYLHIERNGNAKMIFFDTSIKLGFLFQRS